MHTESGESPTAGKLAETAAEHYAERRSRDREFGSSLFADPAWDIMLDLAVVRARGQSVPVGAVCIAACVPESTALRYITVLESEGFVIREADPSDARRSLVRLTDIAIEKMERALLGRAAKAAY